MIVKVMDTSFLRFELALYKFTLVDLTGSHITVTSYESYSHESLRRYLHTSCSCIYTMYYNYLDTVNYCYTLVLSDM